MKCYRLSRKTTYKRLPITSTADEKNPEESFEEENKYREPPAEPMHNCQGTLFTDVNAPGAFVRAATNEAKIDGTQRAAMGSS